MITRGTVLSSGASSPGSCWITLAMLMPCSPRILRQRGEHAGRVGDGEPEVVAAPDLVGEACATTVPRLGPEVEHPRGQDRPAGHHVDQVADHGRGRGHHAGPAAVKEGVAHGVAHDPDGIVGPAHLGQRRAALHQRRSDTQLQAGGGELGQRQQLDRVAQLAGVLEVGQLQPVDALAGDVARS